MKKIRVLFLCTGNAVRSQMAEALLRALGGDRFEVQSAGVAPAGIHPMTLRALEEEGFDLSRHRSKSVGEIDLAAVDLVVTLCGNARDVCPTLPPGIPTEHWPIEDPVGYVGTSEARFQMFRETRERIRERIAGFVGRAGKKKSG